MSVAPIMQSPERVAGGGKVLTPGQCARRSILQCGGLEAARQWAKTWAHRPYFRNVLEELESMYDPKTIQGKIGQLDGEHDRRNNNTGQLKLKPSPYILGYIIGWLWGCPDNR